MRPSKRVFAAVGALAMTACGGESAPDNRPVTTLTIGAVIDQTSTAAFASWPGAGQLAIKQVNDGLLQAGSPIRFKLVLNDTAQDATVTSMRAIDLVRNDGAKSIITDTSKNGIAITKLMYDADTSNDLNVPVVCATCTAAGLSNPMAVGTDDIDTATLRDASNWNFRTCNRGTEQTAVLKRVIVSRGAKADGDVNGDGKFKIAIVVLDDPSGHGFVKSTQSLFAQSNPGVIVEKVVIAAANLDVNNTAFWDGIASKIVDRNSDCPQDPASANGCLAASSNDGLPDALMENLNPGYNIAVSQALARASNTVTFFHAHAFRASQTLDILRSAVNGQQGVSTVLYDDSPAGQQFATELKAATGRGPGVLDSSMYDAVATLALATLKAAQGMADPTQITGAQVRDALAQINAADGEKVSAGTAGFAQAYQRLSTGASINYDGASGPVDFDADGNVWVKLALYQGMDGTFVDTQKFDCVRDHACPAIP